MLEDLIYVRDINDFESIKAKTLNAIDSMGIHPLVDPSSNISNTDWHIKKDLARPYMDILAPCIDDHLNHMCEEFDYGRISLRNYWFQQYMKGDWHAKHTHPDVSYSNVIFIELPEKEISTAFYIKRKQYKVNVSEGQILSFPGMLVHSSPINQSNKRKTSVVFNTYVDAQRE